jgi:hypothetical protein
LQSPDSQVRQGGLECISRVRVLAERSLKSVYRFDVIYGETNSTLWHSCILSFDKSFIFRYAAVSRSR